MRSVGANLWPLLYKLISNTTNKNAKSKSRENDSDSKRYPDASLLLECRNNSGNFAPPSNNWTPFSVSIQTILPQLNFDRPSAAPSPSRSPASDERGVMPCEEGQKLQDEFDKAVADRIRIEMRGPRSTEAKDARGTEAIVLRRRSLHLRKCFKCWRDRPIRSVNFQS
jgi:hypothetical protein